MAKEKERLENEIKNMRPTLGVTPAKKGTRHIDHEGAHDACPRTGIAKGGRRSDSSSDISSIEESLAQHPPIRNPVGKGTPRERD